MAMIGGIILQVFLAKFDKRKLVDRKTISRIQGLALDLLIISAIASLSLTVIGDHIVPFILLALAGIISNIVFFLWLGPKMIPTYWFERGIGDFGQGMGVAATGIMLMRIVDPENKTPALMHSATSKFFLNQWWERSRYGSSYSTHYSVRFRSCAHRRYHSYDCLLVLRRLPYRQNEAFRQRP
ncbi:sodium/glutamate symporter [Bacillus sp. JCM 19047]|nr:sodium/glutamate symporter [Bacillus sp. JCM 19047]